MKPDYEEMLQGATRWNSRHNDIGIELSFHGYVPPEKRDAYGYGNGTWCYYLILDQRMFYPKDWKKLCFKSTKTEHGIDYNYYDFPDVDFHGGITFYEVRELYDRKTGKDYRIVKAGCDYNHLWDVEAGYPDSYESVMFDAKHSVTQLLRQFPNPKKWCEYSGIWDVPEMFYLAKNGRYVHSSCIEKIKEHNWDTWLPKENDSD